MAEYAPLTALSFHDHSSLAISISRTTSVLFRTEICQRPFSKLKSLEVSSASILSREIENLGRTGRAFSVKEVARYRH